MEAPLDIEGVAWLTMTALLCGGAALVAAGGGFGAGSPWASALDWRPGLGLHEPWRIWTGAWVHWSAAHLAVNLAGALVIGAVGWRGRVPAAAAVAWCFAWPLTQILMDLPDNALLAKAMPHYGGLSGVLHAGVIVLGLTLAWPRLATARVGIASWPESGFVTSKASVLEHSRITEGPWAMTSLEELAFPADPRADVDARGPEPRPS